MANKLIVCEQETNIVTLTVTLNVLPNLFVSVFSSPQNYDDDTY